MEFVFLASKLLVQLILPPTGLLIVAIVALLLLKRWPLFARIALWSSVCCLVLLSSPWVAAKLMNSVFVPPMDKAGMNQAQAIMILGGGLTRGTREYGDTPSTHSLQRIRYGAKLAREYKLPVLITGGQVYGGRPEADVMADTLSNEFGVPVMWIENRARHTGENARFSAQLLQKEHVNKVILVTHDYHMRRALAHCKAAGLVCLPAPVTSIGVQDSWIEQAPTAGALQTSAMAIHELLGNLAVGLR